MTAHSGQFFLVTLSEWKGRAQQTTLFVDASQELMTVTTIRKLSYKNQLVKPVAAPMTKASRTGIDIKEKSEPTKDKQGEYC